MANLGSLGAAVPGGEQDPIQAAIEARQQGGAPVPALNQTLTGSPQSSPIPPSDIGATPMPGGQGGEAQKPQISNPEVEIILKALTQRLSMISKLEAPPTPTAGGGNST